MPIGSSGSTDGSLQAQAGTTLGGDFMSHFGIGYASGYLLDEDPLATGIGRLTGEIVAEWQESWVLKAPTETSLSARRQQALMNSQFAGGLVNFCLGLDVTAGGRSAYRVAEHNALEDARLLKIYQNSNFNLKKWAEFLQSLRNQRGESAFIQPTLEGLNNFSHYYLDEGEPTARFYDLQNTLDPMGDQIGIGLPMAIQYGGKALVKIGDGFTYVRNRYDDPNYHTQIPYFGSIVMPLLFDIADVSTSFLSLAGENIAIGFGCSQPVAQDIGDIFPLVAGSFGASSIFKIGSFGTFTSNVVKNFSIQSMNVLKKPFTIMRRENAITPYYGFQSNIFSQPIPWTSPVGTKQTYQIYQRNDINWSMIRTEKPTKFIGKTNLEAALEGGIAPQMPGQKNLVELHHLNQDSRGALVEVPSNVHRNHPHKLFDGNENPEFPINRNQFKEDRKKYWKWRAQNEQNSN